MIIRSEHQSRRFNSRFGKVANRYPRRVAEAYDLDFDRAMEDSDETVAATVADWERRHDLPVRDWRAIGRDLNRHGA